MKKLVLIFGIAGMLLSGGVARAETQILEKLALYVPNRIIDLFDVFTLNIGVGPIIRAELMATRAITVGGGFGNSFKLIKDFNRQYGVGEEYGWYWSLVAIGEEDKTRDGFAGSVLNYWEKYAGVPDPTMRVYSPIDGARDYWQFGGALAFLVEGEFYLHPIEGFDLVAGFFLIDFKQDDLTFADFSGD